MSTSHALRGTSSCLCFLMVLAFAAGLALAAPSPVRAQAMEPRYCDIGSPVLRDIWVDPARGSDSDTGDMRQSALRTIVEAWNRVPSGPVLTGTGYRMMLAGGTYPESSIPEYLEARHGTRRFPVVVQGADGRGAATLAGDLNIYDCSYVYLIDFNIVPDPAGECLHNERCDNFLVRGMRMSGGARAAQETLKVNQCRYYYIEDSDISGSWNVPVDFVAVQYGHVVGSRIHDAGDWCMYFKGGSAYINVEGNELYDADNGGFTAGQGTGFEYMSPPWLHYETYDIKFVNNIVHDTRGAGMGVNGSYNVLMAYNTLYRVGSISHAIEVVHGVRGCDGNTARCSDYLARGGWGTATPGSGNEQPIPVRNVYIFDNVLYNPPGFASAWSHFAVAGPRETAPGSNIPTPAAVDTNLRIRGNMIWNSPADLALGVGEPDQGGQSFNPTCNAAQLRADNAINNARPEFADPAAGDFSPSAGGNVLAARTFAVPAFDGGDRPGPPEVPEGVLDNTVTVDYYGNARTSTGPPGAIAAPPASTFYFAEGYTGVGFDEYLCIGNPGPDAARVSIDYSFGGGGSGGQRQTVEVAPASRDTVNVNSVVGKGREVSARVTSDHKIVVERPMYFDYKGLSGGHVTSGARATARSWYFAEGYTGDGFDEYVCVLNPGGEAAALDFRFQTEEVGAVDRGGLSVAAGSRATFKVNDLLGGAGRQCSLELRSDRPVVAERPMYFNYAGRGRRAWDGGHCVTGVVSMAREFLFAEGTTRAGFDEWLTLQNAGASRLEVRAVYRFAEGQGAPVEKVYSVEPGHRRTVFVEDECGPGKDVAVKLSAGSPFVAERAMYFDYGGGWDGGHCALGSVAAAADVMFAEGCTHDEFDEWLCLLNPGNSAVDVDVTYLTQEVGALAPKAVHIPAGARLTIKVNDHAGAGYQLSARLRSRSGAGFVAERAMYFDYGGGWDGGDVASGASYR